jgi:hypothetical protein
MQKLPDNIEVEIARTRIRDAVRAFSRAPTEANQYRVSTAMKLWRELNGPRIASRMQSDAAVRRPAIPA